MISVSILVPIYNVSMYIERCAHSLFCQTFENIEYIFVNDASPDDSVEKLMRVVEQYPERKQNVKIIHHERNRGLAAARRTALDNASGKYTLVVDSDDFIDKDMIEILYNVAINENADIVVSNIVKEYQRNRIIICDYVAETKEENILNRLKNHISEASLWNKLIRRDMYKNHDCLSPEGLNYLEDRHTTVRLYFYANKIVKVDHAFYHYVQTNSDSITQKKSSVHFDNVVEYWHLLELFLQEQGVLDKYQAIIERGKIEDKVRLMFEVDSKTRRCYADIFIDEEKKIKKQLKISERLMLFFVRNKLFFTAQLLRQLVYLKSKLKK